MHTYSHSCCFGFQFSGVFIAASAAKRFLLLLVTVETASESRARDFIRQQESLALMVNVNVNVVCMDRVAFST